MYIRSNIFLIFLFLCSPVGLNAQNPGNRWSELFSNDKMIIYMDTTSIRQIDNQISVWSLLIYNEVQKKENIDKDVKKIKTQYLLNSLTKQYSVIGTLYYDEKGRIVGESSISRFGNNRNFSQAISENPIVATIFTAAKSYLEEGTIRISGNENLDDYEENAEDAIGNIQDYKKIVDTTNSSGEDQPESVEENKQESQATDEPSASSPNEDKKSTYNSSSEKSAGGTIFTDGNLYLFQLSAWKEKYKAEREIKRLKDRGHNAFITEAYIASKGGTWYRVRIGYFNSYDEARNYQRTMR